MKTIGLLGGTSWISTIEYYRRLNIMIQQQLGGFHSAKIHLHSIDYHPIKSQYSHLEKNSISTILALEIKTLLQSSPDCIILCNHSLHEFFPSNLELAEERIFFKTPELIIQDLKLHQDKKSLLLGTMNTMTRPFYKDYIHQHSQTQVVIPSQIHMHEIATSQQAVARGTLDDVQLSQIQQQMKFLVEQYDVDSVILACTELPLMLQETRHRIIDPMQLQCQAATQFVFTCQP